MRSPPVAAAAALEEALHRAPPPPPLRAFRLCVDVRGFRATRKMPLAIASVYVKLRLPAELEGGVLRYVRRRVGAREGCPFVAWQSWPFCARSCRRRRGQGSEFGNLGAFHLFTRRALCSATCVWVAYKTSVQVCALTGTLQGNVHLVYHVCADAKRESR